MDKKADAVEWWLGNVRVFGIVRWFPYLGL